MNYGTWLRDTKLPSKTLRKMKHGDINMVQTKYRATN